MTTTATRIDSSTEKRLTEAVNSLNVKPSDLLRIGLLRVLDEIEATGGLTLGARVSKRRTKERASA